MLQVFIFRYDFNGDPHGILKWMNDNQWLAVLIDRNWIDKAIEADDRYRDSVSVDNIGNMS